MKSRMRFSTRVIASIFFGLFATLAIDWYILKPTTPSNMGFVYFYGSIYLATVMVLFVLLSVFGSYLIISDSLTENAVNLGYILTTATIFWTIGAWFGYGIMSSLYPGSDYLYAVIMLMGIVAMVVGEFLIWDGQIRQMLSRDKYS